MSIGAGLFIFTAAVLAAPAWSQTEVPKSRPSAGGPADSPASRAAAAVAAARGSEISKLPPTISSPPPPALAAPVAPVAGQAVATAARIAVRGQRTVFELTLTRPVPVQVFTLANPYRIVVDVADMDFDLPPAAGRSGQGLVAAFRYGLFAPGRSRIVIDVTGPVRIVRADTLASPGEPARLQLELEPTTATAYASAVTEPAAPPPAPPAPPPATAPARAGNAFVVMIDPGHGGVDGGAISANQLVEKDIVLAIGRQLRTALEARGAYVVRMTRASDVFISLDQRVALSQAAGANLFLSIHADSVGDTAAARTAHGASIYTLSETASNQAAQAFAEKENSADTAGGMSGLGDGENGQVTSILADLVKRETQNFSLEFRTLLINRLRPTNMLSRDPARAAAFKVLRQMQTPTVLIELGFLTHEMDAQQMQSPDWQKRVVDAIAAAVDAYAARRTHVQR